MEFRDLKRQYRYLRKEIDSNIQNVIDNANFIQGKQAAKLENTLVDYVWAPKTVSHALMKPMPCSWR